MAAWWSRTVLVCAVATIALFPISALGSRFGLWNWDIGFLILTFGTGLATVNAAFAIAAIVIARRRKLRRDLRLSGVGLAICLSMIAYVALQLQSALLVPPIHHISTDTEDPPPFIEVLALRASDSNPLHYDAEKMAPMQVDAYPWVTPLTMQATPEAAFAEVRAALRKMGIEIVAEHPEQGVIEATATTFWFGFKDDIAVRVRPHPEGALVDVRSVSRVGVSDVGVNAERIGEILQHLSGEAP